MEVLILIPKKLGIITFPINSAGITPLSNLVDIICSISKQVYLITGNEGYSHFKDDSRFVTSGFYHKSSKSKILRYWKYLMAQIKISYKLMKAPWCINVWFFFIGGGMLVVPMITAKLLRKKVILILPGSIVNAFKSRHSLLFHITYSISRINFMLADHIILYSHVFIEQEKLTRYINKISIAPRHFVDFNAFTFNDNFSDRENIVGYIGRFSNEKGIMNFITSLPILFKTIPNLNVLLIGDGKLKQAIIDFLNDNKLNNNVNIIGWIEHDNLPEYLSKLKLLVLPSYTEGLPNIVLEAMACGTPVLATPVGSIPDIIKDLITGFILENNSPEVIAKNVIRALEHSDTNQIIYNARTLVEMQFTEMAAVERYKKAINQISIL